MADFTTGAGATFSLSATIPGSFNQAGYEAVSFTEVGKISGMQGVPRRQYGDVSVNYLASAGTDIAKGSYRLGETELTVVLDADDAGQAILIAANDSTATYSVRLDHPVHGTIYAQALIFSGQETWGDNDTPSTVPVTIRYKVASATEDGVVRVAA